MVLVSIDATDVADHSSLAQTPGSSEVDRVDRAWYGIDFRSHSAWATTINHSG